MSHEITLSREFLKRAHEVAGIGTYMIDLQQQIIHVSAEMARLFRAGPEALALPLAEYRRRFRHPEDHDVGADKADSAYKSGARLAQEARVVCGDGGIIWVRSSSSVERNERGESIVVGVVLDITELRTTADELAERAKLERHTQQALAANEELLRQLIRHTPAAVAMFDLDLRYLAASDRWITDYHLEGQVVVGRLHYEVFPDVPERWKEIHGRVLAGAVERCDEDPFPRADGGMEWLEWECRPWRTASGAIGGMIMFTQVITERMRSAARLQESERRFRALTESAPTGIYIRQDNALTYANPAFERMFGYQPGETIGADILSFVHPDDLASATARMRQRVDGVPSGLRGIRKDGATIHVEILGFGVDLDGHAAVVGNVLDITERTRAEQRLRESEDRFRRLSENSLAGIYIVQDNRFVYANPAIERIFGAEPGSLLGTTFHSLIHPDDLGTVTERVRDRIERSVQAVHYEFRALRRDGATVWLEVLGSAMFHEGRPALFGNVLDVTSRKQDEAELERYRQHLEELVAKRTEELARAKDAAESSNRAKSAFLASVSHELRTPLNAILGFSQLMLHGRPADAPDAAALGSIHRAGEQLLRLVDGVLDLTKVESHRLELLTLGSLLAASPIRPALQAAEAEARAAGAPEAAARAAFARLPPTVLHGVRSACLEAYPARVAKLLGPHPEAATAAAPFLDSFRFDQLVALLPESSDQ